MLRTLVALHRLTDDYIELFAGGGDSRAWPYLEDLVRFLAPLEVASVRPMFRLAWGFRARARLPPFEPPSVVHAMQCGRACNADLARTLPRYAIIEHYYPGATVMKIGGGGGGTEIIVDSDNANNNAAAARVEYVGAWTSATATPGYHGTDYRYAATEPVSAPATFWFYLSAAGTRQIDAWWVAGTHRSSAATFTVHDASGAEVGRSTQNQQTAGSQWNALGTFAFTAGWNRVVLSRWQAAGSVVIADAIRAR